MGDSTAFDNRLIPSIFDYPYVNTGMDKDFSYSGTELLASLRIMQLISSHDAKSRTRPGRQPLLCSEVSILLSRLFGYDEELIRWKLVEFSEFDVAYMYGEYDDFDRDVAKLRVRGLPKLDYMIDKYIGDIAYLSLAIMRAPIGPFFGGRQPSPGENFVPFVDVASYEPGGDDLLNWIIVKFLNSISAVRIFNELNDIEEAALSSKLQTVPTHGRYRDVAEQFLAGNPFVFAREMRLSVLAELYALLHGEVTIGSRSFRPVDDEMLIRRCGEYSRLWG